jgi:hypothetical protein
MMSLTFNWVAIALSLTAAAPGVDNPGMTELKTAVVKLRQNPGDKSSGGQISYKVRVVEMEGLEWRRSGFGRLAEVAHQGSATIWTASNRAAQPIIDRASKVVSSLPRITTRANAAAHFTSRTNRSLVTRVSWTDEEPKVSSEAIREGFAATIAGRKLDQGILVQVVINDTEIRSVHDVKLSQPSSASTCPTESSSEKECAAKTDVAESSCCRGSEPGSTVQIPEVASQEVVGEWLIPNDGVLVVGLGIHTASDKDGKAVVRERLMVIEAKADTELMRTASRRESAVGRHSSPGHVTIPAPVIPAPLTIPAPVTPAPGHSIPTPIVPSRTLPQGIHADGTPAELPPLPEDTEPTEADDSAEPHGSPQDRPKGQAVPMPNPTKPDSQEKAIDSQAAQAGYIPANRSGPTRWLPVGARSFPASLDRWIESVRARGMLIKECSNCDETACEYECSDED